MPNNKDLNAWLEYSVQPQQLHTLLHPAMLNALTSVTEGVFGLRWTAGALKVEVYSPWPWANLRNLKVRGSTLDLLLSADRILSATMDGTEVARSGDRKLELPWELFEALPHKP